jgi:hypothetical protein
VILQWRPQSSFSTQYRPHCDLPRMVEIRPGAIGQCPGTRLYAAEIRRCLEQSGISEADLPWRFKPMVWKSTSLGILLALVFGSDSIVSRPDFFLVDAMTLETLPIRLIAMGEYPVLLA